MGIMSPTWLVNNIEIISLITSVIVLVIFSEATLKKLVLPTADFIKYYILMGMDNIGSAQTPRQQSGFGRLIRRYISEAIATVLFIVYCYLGAKVLSEYVINPILFRWRAAILIVTLIIFIIINYVINSAKQRKRFFGVGIYNPEKVIKKKR